MDTPFPYDKFVTGKNFIGRKAECTVLSNLIAQHEHVVLYEPPKAGKTSLIQQAMYSMRYGQRAFTVGQFSVLNIRTVDEFLAEHPHRGRVPRPLRLHRHPDGGLGPDGVRPPRPGLSGRYPLRL